MPHPPLAGVRRPPPRSETSATPKQIRRLQNRQAWQTRQALDRARRAVARAERKLAQVWAALRDANREIERLQRSQVCLTAAAPMTRPPIGRPSAP